MSKELKNISENIMNQINQGKIKMKPKMYFIAGSILAFAGAVSAFVVSTFLVSLVRFSLRSHWGRGAQYKLDLLISNFPWWIVIFAIVSLAVGIWLIRRYDFYYKIKPWVVVLLFALFVVVSGWVIDVMGLNNSIRHRGPMKGVMMNNLQEK